MNHKELTHAIATDTGLPLATVEKVLKSHTTIITQALIKPDGEVTLHNIGKLKVAFTEERQGRNPATGEAITIPAKHRVSFKAAKGLKEALN